MIKFNDECKVRTCFAIDPDKYKLLTEMKATENINHWMVDRIHSELIKKMNVTQKRENGNIVFTAEVYVFTEEELHQLIEEIKDHVKNGRL